MAKKDTELTEIQPGDNTALTKKNMEIFKMPRVDLMNYDAVEERINTYFELVKKYDAKPSLTGLAMALGIDRKRIWNIRTQNFGTVQGVYTHLPQNVIDLIRRTYDFMEVMWEDYMLNGKINPVSGIFLGKNNYGYQDRQDYVLSANNEQEPANLEDLRKRYVIDVDAEEIE